MSHCKLTRRNLLVASLALPVLQGCAAPLPAMSDPTTTIRAQALLAESAAAHGLAAFSGFADVNVSYGGQWRALVGSLQPALVDSGFRGHSEERLLLREGRFGQAHTGPSGHKQVVRHTALGKQGDVRVWFNGEEAHDGERRSAAALVVDGYSLFLLGPMLLARYWAVERSLAMELSGPERIVVGEQDRECDVLRVRMAPGFGFSDADQLALYIDRDERLMRRVHFTLDGLDSTRGAIAEVDAFDHVTMHGVRWPTRFHEQLLRPLPLPVHDWHLTGLNVDRGLDAAEISGVTFGGKAAAPAQAIRA